MGLYDHCEWRSDIHIVPHNSPSSPSLVTTSDDFYDRSNKLHDQLLEFTRERPEGHSVNEDGLESLDVEMVYLGYILLMRRDGGATRRGYDSGRKMGNGGCGRGKVGGLHLGKPKW